MQITFISNKHDSLSTIIHYKDEKIISGRVDGACHGNIGDGTFQNLTHSSLLFKKYRVNVSEEDFAKWIEYCNLCGFPCSYSIETVDTAYDYYKIKGEYYIVHLLKKDYVTAIHLFAAITVIRMISYRGFNLLQVNSRAIIQQICNISEARPDLEPLSVLILAHCVSDEEDHFLLACSKYIREPTYSKISKEEMLKLFLKETSLNRLFSSNNRRNIIPIRELLNKKQYKEIVW